MNYSDNEDVYSNSESASIPRNEFELKYALILICSECGGRYFSPCINHLSGKCDCKNDICHKCFWRALNQDLEKIREDWK